MARRDIEQYLNDLHEAGVTDQTLMNQYAKSLEAGVAIPRHIKDADLIRRVRAVIKKLNLDSDPRAAFVNELIYCIQAGVPEEYLTKDFDLEQFGHVRAGYKEGVDISVYADPKVPSFVMFGARKLLRSGIPAETVRKYMSVVDKRRRSRVAYNTMYFEEEFRWYIEDGGKIEDISDLFADEDACEKIRKKRAALKYK